MPIPKRSASPRPDVDTAAVVSLKVLDPNRPIREADVDQVALTIRDFTPLSPIVSGAPNGKAPRREVEARAGEAEAYQVRQVMGQARSRRSR